jgi:hypothetical protein
MPNNIISFTHSLGNALMLVLLLSHERFVIFFLDIYSSALAGAAAAADAGEAHPMVAVVVNLAHTKMQDQQRDQQRWWPSSPFPAAGKT